ncbi:MAG: ABC transporter ATP-binding protein [Spirochaetia bacterium]|jgi:urea transport system ATP-binding protein
MSILDVRNVTVDYNGAIILNDINLRVEREEFVCVLGRNGVGKTTLMRSIMGLTPPNAGRILFDGEDIAGRKPYSIARKGISYVPQGRQIFPDLTVEENLRAGMLASPGRPRLREELLQYFPFLSEKLKARAGLLSGGQQQILAIARGLAGNPHMMILDEPTEGIQPSIIKDISHILRNLNVNEKITFLLVEQNIDFAFQLASRGYIIEKGRVVSEGTVDVLKEDSIVKSYLII